jgi:hypothetical protein
MIFCLPDLILPIGAKGLECHTMMCCTLSSTSTIGARKCTTLLTLFDRFQILPNITNNLGSSGGKTFFCKIQDCVLLKLKKNVQDPNNKGIPVD